MRRPGAPLRFLALLVGGWMLARTHALLGNRIDFIAPGRAMVVTVSSGLSTSDEPRAIGTTLHAAYRALLPAARAAQRPSASGVTIALPPAQPALTTPRLQRAAARERSTLSLPSFTPTFRTTAPRLSGTGWVFLRQGSTRPLAEAGQLGASQAGARLR